MELPAQPVIRFRVRKRGLRSWRTWQHAVSFTAHGGPLGVYAFDVDRGENGTVCYYLRDYDLMVELTYVDQGVKSVTVGQARGQ